MIEAIQLKGQEPFSKGGNRLCFVHPGDPGICLKVHQPHRTPEARRLNKSPLARLRPLETFDENLQEYQALSELWRSADNPFTTHLPRSFGIVDTDLGPAHAMDLIRDHDGLISETVELYMWNHGNDTSLADAMDVFRTNWLAALPRTRDVIPHNLVIQRKKEHSRIIMIDGFGKKPGFMQQGFISKRKARSRMDRLEARMRIIMDRKANNQPKGRLTNLKRDL